MNRTAQLTSQLNVNQRHMMVKGISDSKNCPNTRPGITQYCRVYDWYSLSPLFSLPNVIVKFPICLTIGEGSRQEVEAAVLCLGHKCISF